MAKEAVSTTTASTEMRTLAIDIETYSDRSIGDTGAFAYADSPEFSILLFAYAFDDDPVRVVDLAQGEILPEEVRFALCDPNVLKTAFNANFETTCLRKVTEIDVTNGECTAVLAAMLGIPGYLEGAGDCTRLTSRQAKTFNRANI